MCVVLGLTLLCVEHIIIIVLLYFVQEVVAVGQNFRSITSQAGLQLSERLLSYPYAVF